MILRNWVKRCLDLDESVEVKKLRARCDWYRNQMNEADIKVDNWKGQANVDATENLTLRKKLNDIRKLLGKDDDTFSKFTRDQIEGMEIDEFNKVEHLIDQDVIDGKLFLQ